MLDDADLGHWEQQHEHAAEPMQHAHCDAEHRSDEIMPPMVVKLRQLKIIREFEQLIRCLRVVQNIFEEMHTNAVVVVACSLLVALSDGFYLPGVAPTEYADGDVVEIKVQLLATQTLIHVVFLGRGGVAKLLY